MEAVLNLQVLDIASGQNKSFGEIKGDRPMVIDFWHTKCVRCPAALGKVNEEAARSAAVFVGCALSQGEGNLDIVRDVVSDWENLLHVFMSMEVKEQTKLLLGFTSVPFVVIIGKSGNILASGDPKSINIHELLEADNKPPTAQRMEFVLDEDF